MVTDILLVTIKEDGLLSSLCTYACEWCPGSFLYYLIYMSSVVSGFTSGLLLVTSPALLSMILLACLHPLSSLILSFVTPVHVQPSRLICVSNSQWPRSGQHRALGDQGGRSDKQKAWHHILAWSLGHFHSLSSVLLFYDSGHDESRSLAKRLMSRSLKQSRLLSLNSFLSWTSGSAPSHMDLAESHKHESCSGVKTGFLFLTNV